MARRRNVIAYAVATATALACGGEPGAPRFSEPAKLALATAPSAAVQNRVVLPTQPQVRLEDAQGAAVVRAGLVVSVAITAGGGTLAGNTSATTDNQGVARFSSLAIAGAAGEKTLTFSSPGLTSVAATVTMTAGSPAALAVYAGNNQTEAEGIAVPVPPAVRVADTDDNPVAGALVTFSLTSGGGSIAGATASSDANGIATVGGWTLGTAGANSLSATATGVPDVTFTATAVHLPVASVVVAAPSSAPLLPQGTRQLTATARDSVGRPLANRAFNWSTSTPMLVSVSSTGLVTATLPGNGSATATSEGKSGSVMVPVVAPTLAAEFWFTGHIGTSINNYGGPPPGFEHGFGFYTSVHTLWPQQLADVQLGWGTWIYPDNRTFGQALCPAGTTARDEFTTWGPTWDGVYQTIEGGSGAWSSNRFPSTRTKYRINGTPDCYDTQVASPGWSFNGDRLPANRLGLAQLSNRLLIPPDGFVFSSGGLFGNAWMALPLIPAYTNARGQAIGDRSITLFANAANFKGAVAFYTPEIWELVHSTDATARGRGHDARPIHVSQMSVEMGSVAFFTGTANGVRYRRLPRLTFPADAAGRVVLSQGAQFYSKAAAWDPFAAWMQNGTVPTGFGASGAAATLQQAALTVKLGGDDVAYPAGYAMGAIVLESGVPALGFSWQPGTSLEVGVFPEYYKETRTNPSLWAAVPASEVPRTTWLADQSFAVKQRGAFPELDVSTSGSFSSANWSGGPFTATLSDGSRVDYVWYKFVDQPAIARLGLASDARTRLQAFAESFHEHGGTQGITMGAPMSGTLATMDAAQIVTPPPGLERGYVPIVIRQY